MARDEGRARKGLVGWPRGRTGAAGTRMVLAGREAKERATPSSYVFTGALGRKQEWAKHYTWGPGD